MNTFSSFAGIGILGDSQLFAILPNGDQIADFVGAQPSALILYRKMLVYNLWQIWVCSGYDTDQIWPNDGPFLETPEGSGWHLKRYPQVTQGPLSSVSGYCTNASPTARTLRMILFADRTSWQWEETNPLVMLSTLNLLRRGLGVNLSSSPGVTARSYVLRELESAQRHHYLSSVEMDLHQIPFKQAGKSLAWKRKLDLSSTSRWYLHCIDKNSMFLSAASGLSIGVGDPKPCRADDINMSNPKAGFYRIGMYGPESKGWLSHFNGVLGPDPLYGTLENENRQEWVTAPLLKLLSDLGFRVKIHEGWQWEKSTRLLEQIAPKLYNLRVQFQADGQDLAADAMKSCINMLFGILGSEQIKNQQYYRPDIMIGTIELAKARMLYNIDKLAAQRGIWPIAVMTDALWYLSPDPDVWTALAPLMDKSKASTLGGFKHEYTLEIDSQVMAALQADSVSLMHRELDALIESRKVARVAL